MFGGKKKLQAQKKEISIDIGVTFIKGVVYGLGMITAFAVVVPLLVWLLGTVDWVPFISDIAIDVAQRMQEVNL